MIGRTALFLPSSSPAMINAALVFNTDSLIFDLEDAVSISEKDTARDLLQESLEFFDFTHKYIIVRINPLDSDYWREDVQFIARSKANAVMIPKARIEQVVELSNILDQINSRLEIIPLIETAIAVEEVADIIKTSSKVKGLLFGAEDYTSDMGM